MKSLSGEDATCYNDLLLRYNQRRASFLIPHICIFKSPELRGRADELYASARAASTEGPAKHLPATLDQRANIRRDPDTRVGGWEKARAADMACVLRQPPKALLSYIAHGVVSNSTHMHDQVARAAGQSGCTVCIRSSRQHRDARQTLACDIRSAGKYSASPRHRFHHPALWGRC